MTSSNKNDVVQVQQLIPIFRSFDEQKAKEFYVDYLGFTTTFEHRFNNDESNPLYFGIRWGNEDDGYGRYELHLSEHHGDATPGSTLRVHMNDLNGFYERLKTKDYKYAKPGPPQKQPWGYYELQIVDPFGNKLIFCQPIDKE